MLYAQGAPKPKSLDAILADPPYTDVRSGLGFGIDERKIKVFQMDLVVWLRANSKDPRALEVAQTLAVFATLEIAQKQSDDLARTRAEERLNAR